MVIHLHLGVLVANLALMKLFLLLGLLRLKLLLGCDNLINFIDELLAEVDSLEVFSVLPEYLQEEFNVFFVVELEGLLNDGRNSIVSILIEHDVSEQIFLFRGLLGRG